MEGRTLTEDPLFSIFQKLDPLSLCQISQVSRQWNQTAQKNEEALWRRHAHPDWKNPKTDFLVWVKRQIQELKRGKSLPWLDPEFGSLETTLSLRNYDYSLKILLFGAPGQLIETFVGNDRLMQGMDHPDFDYKIIHLKREQKSVNLQLWDLSNHTDISSHFHDADALIMTVNLCSPTCDQDAVTLYNRITCNISLNDPKSSMTLAGTNSDSPQQKANDLTAFAHDHAMRYFEVDATTGSNVDELFHWVASKAVEKFIELDKTPPLESLPREYFKNLRFDAPPAPSTKKEKCSVQ